MQFNVGGLRREGGVGGLVEKRRNNEYNVVILFMRGVPAIPRAYPTRCVGCFNIHPGKKKKINSASCRGTLRCSPACISRQRDSLLNSLMITLQVEKKSQENILQRPRGDAASQERAEEFSDRYQNTQLCPPNSLWYVSIMRWAAHLKNWAHTHARFHQGCWQLEKQQRVCMFFINLNVFAHRKVQ